MTANFIPDSSLYFYKKLLTKSDDFSGKSITINYLEDRTGIYHMAIIGLLINLLENKLISFENGQLSNGYIKAYNASRERFERIQAQRSLSAVVSGGVISNYDYKKDPAWQRIADEYCDLGKEVFNKLSKNEKVDFEISKEILEKSINAEIKTFDYLTFELKIDKSKLKKYLNSFLEDFIKNKFNIGLEYAYFKQEQFISATIQKLINDGFPKENLWLNPQHFFPKDKMNIRPTDEKPVPLIYFYNFIPTVLAMEKEGFLTVLDMLLTANSEKISNETIRRVSPFDAIWKEITQIRIRVEINDKFNTLFPKNTNTNTIIQQKAEEKTKPEENSDSRISYEYTEHSEMGTLKIGDLCKITFRSLRAKIIEFLYASKKIKVEYKNYSDFNNFLGKKTDDWVSSDEFSKEVSAINKRIAKESRGLMKQMIIKKDKGQINEVNYYKFA